MEGKTVAARIHDLHGELTAAGRKTARGLLGNYPLLGLAPVADFASGAGVSAATVVRFVAQLGFNALLGDNQRADQEISFKAHAVHRECAFSCMGSPCSEVNVPGHGGRCARGSGDRLSRQGRKNHEGGRADAFCPGVTHGAFGSG